MRLLVFLPCLNEAKTLAEVIAKIPRAIPQIAQVDILVINDGSSDDSAIVAQNAGAKVITNASNMGVGYCFQRAVRYAIDENYDLLCNMDADGQFDPSDIPRLIAPIVHGKAEFVSGTRFLQNDEPIENMSPIKSWGNRQMNRLVSRLSRRKFTDVSCGFRCYAREALLRLNLMGRFTYTQEVFLNLAFQGTAIVEVPIRVRYFRDRRSRIAHNLLSYTVKTLKIIFRTYRDYQPLRFFASIAAVFLVAGFSCLAFLGFWWIRHQQFSPHIWSGFLGGAFCFCALIFGVLGLLADMLTRLRAQQEELLYLLRRNAVLNNKASTQVSRSSNPGNHYSP